MGVSEDLHVEATQAVDDVNGPEGSCIDTKPNYSDATGITSFEEVSELRQGLHQRHIQMIALAGTIGTGLFLGSGLAVTRGGPLGAFLGYTFVGLGAAAVCLATGEMGALVPLSGGIIRYAETFVDPALSFAEGWNGIYSSFISTPAELVAATVLIRYWITINNAIVGFPKIFSLYSVLFSARLVIFN